jgi:uncharacterized protein YpuA (DUF1002 family)
MTQELQDKIRAIAEYDEGDMNLKLTEIEIEEHSRYLTSMDWLHPVAMKVKGQLKQSKAMHWQFYNANIALSLSSEPINGEYIDLFNDCYKAIQLLNQMKEKK